MVRLIPLLLAGCVIPLPIEGEPIERNFPPFYTGGSLAPSPNEPAFDPETEETREWCVHGVEDPNARDRIFYRWFINYDGVRVTSDLEGNPPGGRAQVEGGLALCFPVRPCEHSVFPDEQNIRELHTIELIIADREFKSNDELLEGEAPFRALPEDATSVRITWFLQFETPCPAEQ